MNKKQQQKFLELVKLIDDLYMGEMVPSIFTWTPMYHTYYICA